ncbi:hypothetical protein FDT66_08065 [Polaribacter aestuariivivens]|uniref:Uncharacterized protein n=1 Tax=Polaribacter aestuariivivens TaxID=2304626 RepID=A0A5S3N8V6_9FLAO|nr:hypothetical protein [Polaribacter aestuariivivens]TMM29819.1 hypothetical protein FDT66_08065 [Polaribacter aestuariivivens]
MKKIILILFCFSTNLLLSQETEEFSILKNTKNWKKEIIKFPIDWAPDLNVTGFEELRFSPNWADAKNDEFWSLVIAWKIDATSILTTKEAEHNLKSYFDGLMKPNHWSKEFPNPKVTFKKDKNSSTNFTGEMTFFDGFHTGKVITVHIKGEQFFCNKQQKNVIVFRLSPKNTEHKIWKTLEEIELDKAFCEK